MSELRPRLWSGLKASELLEALADPPDRYRSVPWLAWTGELDWAVLREQLSEMLDKGITEFFLFPIYGMELPYMSAAYWERVGQMLAFCCESGMKCWIYDEYNWPSGVCAGAVLRDYPEASAQILWLRADSQDNGNVASPPGVENVRRARSVAWAIGRGTETHTNVKGCDWLSAVPGYLDVLSPEACRRFIEYTHDRYHSEAAEMFPDTIPGFFTDEPGFDVRAVGGWIGLPFTDGLFEDFRSKYGYDLTDRLGDLVAELPLSPGAEDRATQTRCHYWRLVAERFGEAYGGQQRAWCDAHGVVLTGHCLGEETLLGHVCRSGDLWEAMKHFTIPGVDLLANADGFTHPYRVTLYGLVDRRGFHLTCKLIHGVVRHSGAYEMLSEAYGVCDWGMNLFRQKRGFNYQVALGVTLFNDNSLITSIADFRKYALAGKHFTQPWWLHYRAYGDYNARLAALHAEGEPAADVAVLYPRSTAWAYADATALTAPWQPTLAGHPMGELQAVLFDLLDEMIRRQWHFDFIFEPVLAGAKVEGEELVTEHARYRAVVVPSARYLPAECAQVLDEFARAGGILVFAGDLPKWEANSGADLQNTMHEMLERTQVEHVEARGAQICEALGRNLQRPLVLAGNDAREFVCSWRRIAGSDVFFVTNMAERPVDIALRPQIDGPTIVCDPDTLECYRPSPDSEAENSFNWHFEPWQGFLVIIGEAASAQNLPAGAATAAAPAWRNPKRVELLEGEWEFAVEPGNMLRLVLQARPDPDNRGAAAGWQHDHSPQGWITPVDDRLPEPIVPTESPWYWLRGSVTCEGGSRPEQIIADNPDFLEVFVNGEPAHQVAGQPVWTEENVRFEVADLLVEGENFVHIRARTSKYNDPRIAPMPDISALLQPVVLLGEFLVGSDGHLLPWTNCISTDAPWEAQGLPHFAGVGVYRRTITIKGEQPRLLRLPSCRDSVEVRLNGECCGIRPWPPYLFDLSGYLREGDNQLEIRVHNTLGNIITRTYGGQEPSEPPLSGLLAAPQLLAL